MPAGRLIVIEGPDGVGKTTVAGLVRDRLIDERRDAVVITASAGATEWARRVNEAMHDRDGTLDAPPDPLAFQMVAAACARDGIARTIRPLLDQGTDVVCDRLHAVSSLVYGTASGCDPENLADLVELTDPPPARWFVLAAPWSVLSRRRALGKDVWERRGEDFAALVAGIYSAIDGSGGQLEQRIRRAAGWGSPTRIDAIGLADTVADAILDHLAVESL